MEHCWSRRVQGDAGGKTVTTELKMLEEVMERRAEGEGISMVTEEGGGR